MEVLSDLCCSECEENFNSASLLLKHFANHAQDKEMKELKKSQIPNLDTVKKLSSQKDKESDLNFEKKITPQKDNESDSGIEDVLNPLKYCLVTMDESSKLLKISRSTEGQIPQKKYQCLYCLKRFGWSTDLKRHTLIHTGERPFKCNTCNSSFTRNFLLQKHQRKLHKSNLPESKPNNPKKNQKQDKEQTCDNSYQTKYDLNTLICIN